MPTFFASIFSLLRRAAAEDSAKTKAAEQVRSSTASASSASPRTAGSATAGGSESAGYDRGMSGSLEISVRDVKARLDKGETLHLIDVREPMEFETAQIPGSTLIPMRQVPGELQKLETKADEAPLIVFCHHGMRSLNVVHWLREQGVENCVSMAGGIDAWSREADTSVPRY